ncbi:hypothetical protein ACH4OW_13095 [Streptomyces sp. NPDC017056]|uniref:hypothetical protein n=1 Tax=Streptomyces sp. NPDC017056 TaxID=3364973 RepID=UPI0037AFAD09
MRQWFETIRRLSPRTVVFQGPQGVRWVGNEKGVGRNASLLLNVPPGRDGRIAAADVASLAAFGRAVRDTYGRNVLERAPGARPGGVTFDRVGLGEDLRSGQRVERFAVEARTGGAWRRIAEGTTVGHRRILVLPAPAPVTADAVRVRVLAARAAPRLGPVTAHLSRP